jgi:3-oxoacyl-(acyl-carrier-protein) synthase
VSIIHDTQGPSNTITCGEASAGLALAEAARAIQRGAADIALAGGCESKVHPMALMRWSLLGRLASKWNDNPAAACRPYDAAAGGAVIAEGGAVMVIEELEHARKRGATIYAELAGFGSTSSASQDVIAPDVSGEAPAAAMKKAMREAGATAQEIGLVIAPGYAVAELDHADAAAMKRVFEGGFGTTTVLPARGGVGSCGAGAQAIDLAAAALAIRTQTIPPATNVEAPIDGLPIARQTREGNVSHAMVFASALGGQNSAVVLKRVG